MVVAKDRSEALAVYTQVLGEPNYHSRKILLEGLDPDAIYELEGTGEMYSGDILMKGGFLVRGLWGDAVGREYHFTRIN